MLELRLELGLLMLLSDKSFSPDGIYVYDSYCTIVVQHLSCKCFLQQKICLCTCYNFTLIVLKINIDVVVGNENL